MNQQTKMKYILKLMVILFFCVFGFLCTNCNQTPVTVPEQTSVQIVKPDKLLADSLQDQALALYHTRDYTPAMQKYLQALDIYTMLQDHKNIYFCNMDIGLILFASKNFNQAIPYFEQAYLHVHKTTYIRGEVISLIRTMRIHNMTNHPEQSYQYYKKGLAIFEQLKQQNKLSDPDLYGRYIEFISHANYITKETNHEADYLYTSQEFAHISTKNMTPNDLGTYYLRLGDIAMDNKDYTTALRYYTQITNNPKTDSGIVSVGLWGKSIAYEGLKDYKQALEYHKLYTKYQSKVNNTQAQKEKIEVEAKHTTEKHELQLAKQKLELDNQNLQIRAEKKKNIALYFGLWLSAMIILSLWVLWHKMKQSKKFAEQMQVVAEMAQEELLQQKDIIEHKNKDITDSINYAMRIQTSVLPQMAGLQSFFESHFVLYKPKDIVSGDFYWKAVVENKMVFAVADCTGHGVPGAFMSMLGSAFLNDIVSKEYITHTGVILRRLRKEVIRVLGADSQGQKHRDGMDMAIICYNKESQSLQFSGANRPLYLIRNGGLMEYKGDKMPIGLYERMDKFSHIDIEVQAGDVLYLFSDGFVDQFGGEKGKKFMTGKFKELLLSLSHLSMSEQETVLLQTLQQWTHPQNQPYEQVDDITVVGLKI